MAIPFPDWFIGQHKISMSNIFFSFHTLRKIFSQFIVTHIFSWNWRNQDSIFFFLVSSWLSLDPINPFNPFLGSKAYLAFLSRLLTPRRFASGPWLRVFHITRPFTFSSLQPKASSLQESNANLQPHPTRHELRQRKGVGQPPPIYSHPWTVRLH